MSASQGSINVQQKRRQVIVPPATVTGAKNGLSLDLTDVELGQDIGAVGDPAILLNNREIPFGGFNFAFGSVGDRKLFFDLVSDRYRFGDVDNATMGMLLDINAGNDSMQLRTPGVQFFIGSPDTTLGISPAASFGSIGRFDGTRWDMVINVVTGASTAILQNTANNRLIDSAMQSGVPGNFINIGGVGSLDNGNGIFINDVNETVRARINDRSGFLNKNGLDWYLDIDPAGFFVFGDSNNSMNGTKLFIDDTLQVATIETGGDPYLNIDPTAGNNELYLADFNNTGTGFYASPVNDTIDISNTNQVLRFNKIAGLEIALKDFSNNQSFGSSNAGTNWELTAANGLKIIGDAAFLLHTGQAMTDGAGAALGTLTNAPAAGDPTKWIAIDDNGTTRFIPAW